MDSQGVAISMVYPIMKTIVHKGFDTEQYCSYASFDAGLLSDVEARISAEELVRLMIAAAHYTQDDHFGLHQGEIMEFGDLGILGYVMMHSRTIAESLAAYQRYNVILSSGFNLEWEVQGDDLLIRLFLEHSGQMSRHCVEDMASSVYRLIGRLSNRRILLNEVQFSHEAPSDTSPYTPVFGVIPKFGGEDNVLRMSKDVLSYSVMYSDSKLLGVFEAIAQETKDGLMPASVFSEKVIKWMKKCIPSYFPTLQQTAESFGISTRTLQNKLKEEFTTYNDLSIRVRKELAMGYLKKWEYSVGEIAYVMHFSEPSAFQSAFKKWTGLTPGQYRTKVMKELTERSS
ncbi:AraC family transcriptional regulator [Paenibacillus sp. FJAT-27812]|uniref:AraC family transcriptional regulator n=1 Tax=Paenibacillus sp. FJAT-27812 TaxID=1684143 RepID=UPI0006A7D13A|nr:AraC family transcriptional regulator [Paenibacillus sp. FJAT-27812]